MTVDFRGIGDCSQISKEKILELISEKEIFDYYCERDIRLGDTFNSPLRKDENPSFNVFENDEGSLLYKDFGTGEVGDCVTFVMKKCFCTYGEALNIINNDFNLGLSGIPKRGVKRARTLLGLLPGNNIQPKAKKHTVIQVKPQGFKYLDLKFWESFGISIEILTKYKVHSCKEVYVNGSIIYYTKKNPIYSYQFGNKYKIYMPFASKPFKWLNNASWDIIQGFEQLPEFGDILFITKALKDGMCLVALNYSAIAPQSEGTWIDDDVIKNLKERFKRIIILYDDDDAGNIASKKLADYYNLEKVFIPIKKGIKDISDYRKINGKEKTITFIKNLIR